MTPLKATLLMHLVALLWGASGVLGSIITVPSTIVTAGRSICSVITLLLVFRVTAFRELTKLNAKQFVLLFIVGALLGIHWIFFFKSIKEGGVALALVTYATVAPQIAILEVIFLKVVFRRLIFVAAMLSTAGVWVIHPVTDLTMLYHPGFAYGMAAAFVVSIMAIIVKQLLTQEIGFLPLSIIQVFGAFLVSLPLTINEDFSKISITDVLCILALGVLVSAIGQTLFNHCLKFVRTSTALVIASMEAPYGVLLSAIFLGQELTMKVIVGVILVTAGAIIVSIKQSLLTTDPKTR